MNALGKFLKEFRTSKAWTQDEIAEKMHVSSYWYKCIENGKTKPGFTATKEISRVCRISIKKINELIEKEE